MFRTVIAIAVALCAAAQADAIRIKPETGVVQADYLSTGITGEQLSYSSDSDAISVAPASPSTVMTAPLEFPAPIAPAAAPSPLLAKMAKIKPVAGSVGLAATFAAAAAATQATSVPRAAAGIIPLLSAGKQVTRGWRATKAATAWAFSGLTLKGAFQTGIALLNANGMIQHHEVDYKTVVQAALTMQYLMIFATGALHQVAAHVITDRTETPCPGCPKPTGAMTKSVNVAMLIMSVATIFDFVTTLMEAFSQGPPQDLKSALGLAWWLANYTCWVYDGSDAAVEYAKEVWMERGGRQLINFAKEKRAAVGESLAKGVGNMLKRGASKNHPVFGQR